MHAMRKGLRAAANRACAEPVHRPCFFGILERYMCPTMCCSKAFPAD